MNYHPIHSFSMTIQEMENIQKKLAAQITVSPLSKSPQWVAGVDVAYFDPWAVAVVVIMDYKSKKVVEKQYHLDRIHYPYIPGYLTFRELPIFLKAWEKVKTEPDLVFFDGNGLLHPRRMGIATHASFFINKPTIGVAKSQLLGSPQELGEKQGDHAWIMDCSEVLGAVVRTQDGVKPIYVSIGNHVSLENAIQFTLQLVGTQSRVPEITRQADRLTRVYKKEFQQRIKL